MNEPANTRHEIEIVNGGGAVPSAVQTATEHWLEANQRATLRNRSGNPEAPNTNAKGSGDDER
jgi:hypothetical protein